MIDRANAGSEIGEELLCCSEDLFTWWYRVRDGTLSRSTFQRYAAELRPWVRSQLEAGTACGCAKTAGTCREILAVEPALWTFARVAGVEPTNNAAERALRHAVLWRKASYGTDSEAGSHFVENILTVVATCRQQGRNVLNYLTQCRQAALEGNRANFSRATEARLMAATGRAAPQVQFTLGAKQCQLCTHVTGIISTFSMSPRSARDRISGTATS
jgi:transposase